MSDVATICAEFGITVVPPSRRRTGGAALETLQGLLSDWGEPHLPDVLLSIVESAGNDRPSKASVSCDGRYRSELFAVFVHFLRHLEVMLEKCRSTMHGEAHPAFFGHGSSREKPPGGG